MKKWIHNHWATFFWAFAAFVVAILIRLPSCYESFWLDELHTAWAIWGDFADVSPRAAVGNQTPLYFYFMWIWKAVVGESEVMLRMSSVLAVALGSALLVVGIHQATQRLSAGVFAGGILVVESNSLFFGTEFRPYAFVMLLSVVATWATMRLIQSEAKDGKGKLRLILTAAISLAALIHPTSIVTLALLPVALLIFATVDRKLNLKFQILDFISLILVAAVVFALTNSSLGHSWENRSQWRAFGQATSASQFWAVWPWLPLAIVPATLALAMLWRESKRSVVTAMVPMVVGVFATGVFFVASYYDWVPLWHRRYFVAALPMLVWSAGACVAKLPAPVLQGRIMPVGPLVIVVLICMQLWQQGTLAQWQRYQAQLVFRGEDWRGAVAWIQKNAPADGMVGIDSGLIESAKASRKDSGAVDWFLSREYQRFPVLGPYRLTDSYESEIGTNIPKLDVQLMFRRRLRPPLHESTDWLLSRSSESQISRWLESRLCRIIQLQAFGGVRVVEYEFLAREEISDRLQQMGF
jgi:hypothetical protein